MTYCSKCGNELTEGAAFCASCGAAVGEESAQRKQMFVGIILKCPNCGEQIGSDTAKCPSCGFVIEKKRVSSALDVFIKKILSLKTSTEKREYIESYAIPNNKEDIRDLLNYAASQRDKDYMDSQTKAFWVDVWNNKCRQIVNQAFDTFGADTEFSSWLKNYKQGVDQTSSENEKLKKKLEKIDKNKKLTATAKVFFKWFFIVILGSSLLIGAGVGIRSCTIKMAENSKIKAEKKLEAQKQAEAKAAERQKLLNGCTIPKGNIILGGFVGDHFVAESDVVATLKTTKLESLWGRLWDLWDLWDNGYATHSISFKIKAIDDVSAFIKKTVEEQKNSLIMEKGPEIYRYDGIELDDNLKIETNYGEIDEPSYNPITANNRITAKAIASQIINAKKGDIITITFDAKDGRIADGKKKEKDLEESLIQLHSSGYFHFQMSFGYTLTFIEKEGGSASREHIYF